jgi:hypothetical protein
VNPGQKGILTIEVAANPNLTAVDWKVNDKEADGENFKPLSICQWQFKEVQDIHNNLKTLQISLY